MVLGVKYFLGQEDFTLESIVNEYVQSAYDSNLNLNQLSVFAGISIFDGITSVYREIEWVDDSAVIFIEGVRIVIIKVDTFYSDELRIFPIYRDSEGKRINYRKFNNFLKERIVF